jgi:hypothetical protein
VGRRVWWRGRERRWKKRRGDLRVRGEWTREEKKGRK